MLKLTDCNYYNKVVAFYDRMGFRRPVRPSALASARRSELMAYFLSEIVEFGNSAELIDQVDALVDLLFFVMDGFVEVGVDPARAFEVVWEANMAKLWPDGKVHLDYSRVPPRLLRPEGWVPPEEAIAKLLEENR